MTLSKSLITTLLLAALITTLTPPTFAETNTTFPDVSTDAPTADAINYAKEKGFVAGYADGTFAPDSNINRAEFVKVIVRAALGEVDSDTKTDDLKFSDLENGAWYVPDIRQAVKHNLITGYDDGTFRPAAPVNFAEAAKIVAAAEKLTLPAATATWFERFTRALAEKNAVPVTIASFDSYLTRGEFVEILYRLKENKTDKPSLTYTTLIAASGTTNAIPKIDSCSELKERMAAASAYGYGNRRYFGTMVEDAVTAVPTAASTTNESTKSTAAGAADQSADYSKTNVQVEGVDEADTVKTDGKFAYLVRGQTVRIVSTSPASEMKEIANIEKFGDGTFTPTELFIDGDRLIVIGSTYRGVSGIVPMVKMAIMPIRYDRNVTRIVIFDIADRTKPTIARTVEIEGNYTTSRLIGHELYLVADDTPYYHIWLEKTADEELLPAIRDSANGNTDESVAKCSDVAYFPRYVLPNYLIVAGLDVTDDTQKVARSLYLGQTGNVYASAKNLYVAATTYDDENANMNSMTRFGWFVAPPEKTTLYRFGLKDGAATFTGRGSVDGTVLNQFSMDESDGYFRLATTEHNWMNGENASTNNLFVLDSNLKTAGQIREIAPGESLYAARFLGARAYLVTFEQVDPLFVIDLKTPTAPQILGKLKIPGYSNYLHPYDETHLIGIGKEVDASIDADKVHSTNAVYYTAVQGLKLALFDVTDVANPREMFKTVVGDRGSESIALTDHKAFLFEKARNLFAIPAVITKRAANVSASESGEPIFDGALVYSLDLTHGFVERTRITHLTDTNAFAKAGNYYYGGTDSIERIFRVGETLFTYSDAAIQANSLATFEKVKRVDFAGEK